MHFINFNKAIAKPINNYTNTICMIMRIALNN